MKRPLVISLLCTFICLLNGIAYSQNATGPSEKTSTSWWLEAHAQQTNDLATFSPDILFLGDSITDWFDEGLVSDVQRGEAIWTNYYAPRLAYNAGIGGDRIEDLRWRVENGLFANTNNDPKVIVMLIGQNNGLDPETNQVAGMRMIVDYILTNTTVTSDFLILGTFPSGSESFANDKQGIFDELAKWPPDDRITITNINHVFLNASNGLNTTLFSDGVHPNEQGYQVWYEAMEPVLSYLLGAQMTVSTNELAIDEGSHADLSVRLDREPRASATVTVTRISGSTNITVSSGHSLVFTATNWSSPQPVTVSAASDEDWDDEEAVIQCSAPGMNNLTIHVTVDDDEQNPYLQLPFNETFENNASNSGTPGTLHGQRAWSVSGNGFALVQSNEVYEGTQALSISNAVAAHSFDGAPTEVQVRFRSKPVFSERPPKYITDGASAVFYINTNAQIVAYDSTNAFILTASSVSNDWNTFEVHCDYISRVWNLWVNDTQVLTNFSFHGAPPAFHAFEFSEASFDYTTYVDDIAVTASQSEPDSDGDGLPDSWEQQYFGGTTNANPIATASNGVNSVQECYIAGISPVDPDEFFKITGQQNSIIQWNAISGRVYTVYWTSNLLKNFQILETNFSGSAFSNTTPSGFYRIGVKLAD